MKIDMENIHENKIKCTNTMQITLDDDFNVPDNKPDIDTIVKERGNIQINPVKPSGEHAQITGTLEFSLLYIGSGNDKTPLPVKMTGSMPVNESINLAEDSANTYATCNAKIEDLTIKTINSRKISVKAIVTLTVTCEQIEDVSVGCDVVDITEEDCMQICRQEVDYAQLAVNLRDNFRIRESVQLSAGKPNVAELLWDDVDIRNMDTRLTDEGLSISGELSIFVMYLSSDDKQAVEWDETTKTFSGMLDINGCNADMVSCVRYNVMSTNVEVKPDYDGESREIAIDMALDMDVKAYEEQKKEIIKDMYSPVKQVNMQTEEVVFKKLLVRNNSKCRAIDTIKASDYVNMLQICNCTGVAEIDDVSVEEDGLQVDGAVIVNVFYVTSDDNAPMGSIRAAVPFSNKVAVKHSGEIEYNIEPYVEQLQAVMTGKNEIEIKSSVSLDTICFEPYSVNTAKDCEVQPFEESEFLKFPSIIGYIANGEETLWEIARKYHTTTESIRKGNISVAERINDTAKVRKGEKLLLVKAAR